MKQLDLISEEIEEEEQEDESDEIQSVLDEIWDVIPASRPEDEEEEEEPEEVDLAGDIEYDEAPEVEEFELTDQAPEQPEVAEKPKKKVFEDPKAIPPTFAILSPDDIASDASPRQRERIDRLSKLLASHNIDINDYDPNNIMWREWPYDDIREYNNLINYIKFDSHDWAVAGPAQKEIDPYAMAQIRIDLWPDVAVGQTTIRQAIVDILHTGNPNAWSEAERGTDKYNTLKSLYAASREYYRTHHDKASQLDNVEFLNEYSEHNSVTPTGVVANLDIGLWKVKGTDKYIPVSFKETERAQEAARKEGRDTISISRGIDPKTKKPRQIPLERPVAMAEIKGQLSFAPRSNRRVIDNHGWSKAQKVGALNNAIVNLFSSPKFDPYMIKKNPQSIDWPTIAGLKTPLEFYNRMSAGVRGNYLLGWEDDQLLKLLRMFTGALPSTARYDDEMRALQQGLEDITNEQRKIDSEKRIEELQGLIDNPPSPNREEWDRNYVDGKSYPPRVASPSETLDSMVRNIGDLYLYKYIGPNPDLYPGLIKNPRKIEKGLENFKYVGPLRDTVALGVVGELKNIEAMVDKARGELKRGDNDIVNVDSPAEEIEGEEELEVTEGIITTPSIIIVNGGPFKLRLGDRLIIDNLKK